MDQTIQKTPEREAFYRTMDGNGFSAPWNVMGDLIAPKAVAARIVGGSTMCGPT